VARAAFPKGSLAIRLRDELGVLVTSGLGSPGNPRQLKTRARQYRRPGCTPDPDHGYVMQATGWLSGLLVGSGARHL
jgi:hypothetical protein